MFHRFYEKGASGAKKQIRIAAPHFEIGFGHRWANFNTQSVQTLSVSRFVASRSSGNHDSWHGFSEFYEQSSYFMKLFNRFYETGASCTKNQIRIASPHFHVRFGYGWVNFDTQDVQTLSV